jgi:hypothetical protein
VSFEWYKDGTTSKEFSSKRPYYELWACVARGPTGVPFAHLGGIDFGRNKELWGQPYKRVVEAELALEFVPD